jgi:hypothetical protein
MESAMARNQHVGGSKQLTQNQNNRMSDDPKHGSRGSKTPGKDDAEPLGRSPEEEGQDEASALEAFGEEGAGIAAKE